MTRIPKAVSEYMSRLGTRGGKIGGKRSLETMTAEQRQERARKASAAATRARKAKARRKVSGN